MAFLQKILKKEDGLSAKKINEKKSTSGEARSYQPYDQKFKVVLTCERQW